MKSTFSVIYYLKRQVVKKDGTVPVMGRITVDGTQMQFSCKLTVDPKLWDTKGGRVTGRSTAALETNRMLDKMRVRINRHYQEIMERDNFVTAEKVKNAFLGLEHRYHTLMQVFRQHNEDYEKQVEAGMKAKGTLLKYKTVYKHLQEFLSIRYRVKDIALKELTPAFISDFEMFLRTDKHCCTNTVWLYVCPLRTMVFIAINNEWLTRDPFREYEIKKEETVRSFLTKEEIRLLMEGRLKNAKQELYRDLYLFCAFTALTEQIAEIAAHVRAVSGGRKEESPDRLLTTREAAHLLNVSCRTLQRMRSEQRIAYVVLRGKCRYRQSEIDRLLEDSTITGDAATPEQMKRNHTLRTGGKPKGRRT